MLNIAYAFGVLIFPFRGAFSMKVTKGSSEGDRYKYDFDLCSYEKGWVQIDTNQNAWFSGHWCNLGSLQIFTFCEGDTYLTECESIEEFKQALTKERDYYLKDGRWNIDVSDAEKAKYIELGFETSLYRKE